MHLELEDLTEQIIGAATAVHQSFGTGFTESRYQAALAEELRHYGFQVALQRDTDEEQHSQNTSHSRWDLLVENSIAIEIRRSNDLNDVVCGLIKPRLNTSEQQQGLLLDFSESELGVCRITGR